MAVNVISVGIKWEKEVGRVGLGGDMDVKVMNKSTSVNLSFSAFCQTSQIFG